MGIQEGDIKHPSYVEPTGVFSYLCGHCKHQTSGRVVAYYPTNQAIKWLLCTNCGNGSVSAAGNQIFPTTKFGEDIEGLPNEIQKAYDEARNCFSVGAYTATELICRKILMHVGVEKGANDSQSFEFYIDYLKKSGYVTEAMKSWVDLIRTHGNKSTHKLDAPDSTRAESTIKLTAQLLKIIYEMKSIADKYAPQPP